MAYIGKEPIVGNFQKCDALTATTTADYTLQVSSTNVVPESVNHMIVSLTGVIQSPTTAYTVAGSTLSFASSLTTSDTIDFVILLGNVLDIGTPSDATVSNAKLGTDLISGETDIGGAIADADLFLLDDGAGGTLRKTAASRIKTYIDAGANTPAFMAKPDGDITIGDDTVAKLTFATEDFDTDGNYATSRFTPQTAGKYMVSGACIWNTNTGANTFSMGRLFVYKNGSEIFRDHVDPRTSSGDHEISDSNHINVAVDMNGSSDYVELYGYVDVQGTGVAAYWQTGSYFSAFRIIT